MKTHEYTDDQIQKAIDAAFPQAGPSYLANLDTLPDTHCWPAEAPNRLAIGKAFLAALSEPTQEEQWQAEFEACFQDFDLTKQDTGGYLHAHAATAWRAFLAAKKGGAK